MVNQGQLRDKVNVALDALKQANDPLRPRLLRRGSIPVRLRDSDNSVEIEALDEAGFFAELSEAADWFRLGRDGNLVATDPSAGIVKAIRGRRQFDFPPIDGIAYAPFFTRDGELVAAPGYHAGSRVYLALEQSLANQLGAVPRRPTEEQVAEALSLLLDELFYDFPFADEAARAHAVELALLPFVRKMIDGPTPNHAVTAPARGAGTGKGLLVHVACAPALGEITTIPETNSDEELKKFLLAILIEGAPIALLDNRKHTINSGVLAAVLTARYWQDRILGKTKTARPTVLTTWVITGNAVRVSEEIGRRTIWIRLNANMPRAWTRTGFKHELPAWAYQRRADLIRACLTLVNNWIAKGRPDGKQTLGSFESWARVMGGILEVAGIPGFLAESPEAGEENEDDRRWDPFVERWWMEYQERSVLPGGLIDLASELVPETERDGRSRTEQSRITFLAYLLDKHVDQVFELDGSADSYLKIVRAEVQRTDGRGARRGYALQRMGKNPTGGGEGGETGKNRKKPAQNKENSAPTLSANPARASNKGGGAQVPDFIEESKIPPPSPSSSGQNVSSASNVRKKAGSARPTDGAQRRSTLAGSGDAAPQPRSEPEPPEPWRPAPPRKKRFTR